MINWLYIYFINNKKTCGASDWRRTVWPGLRLGASVSRGTAPLPMAPLRHPGSWCSHPWSMPRYMYFQALDFSPLHYYIHYYISTIYSLRPQGLCRFSFLCVLGQYTLRACWALKKTKELLVSLDAIRVGQDQESHILYLILKNSIWSTSF